MFIGTQSHYFIRSRFVRNHCQSGFLILVVDGIVDCTHVGVVISELTTHRQQQCDSTGTIFHCGKMKWSVLEKMMVNWSGNSISGRFALPRLCRLDPVDASELNAVIRLFECIRTSQPDAMGYDRCDLDAAMLLYLEVVEPPEKNNKFTFKETERSCDRRLTLACPC